MARARLAIALWLAGLAACVFQVTQTRFVADLSLFLPAAPTAEQRLLVDQLRDGALTRVMLIGIEGADASARARLSRELAASLGSSPLFASVANGASGAFERLMEKIPLPLAGALLAGVLARFGLDAFLALRSAPGLVLAMLAAYLLGRRLWPRYAVVGVLAVGVAIAAATGRLHADGVQWAFTVPVFTAPEFSWRATVSLALPLFIVTMASQNLPGVAAIRAAGYRVPISKIISLTGVATLLLAPFGAFALNLAAITAAICLGREAHADPDRRWVAAAANGILYCIVGVFGAAVAGLLAAFPRELVIAVAGLALLGTIASGLAAALEGAAHREAALITFLVTLSGIELLGVGSAFWGVIAGATALFVQQWRPRRDEPSAKP